MSFKDNLDILIEQQGITQEELARIAGVTPGAVTGWRNGSTPRKRAIAHICDNFNLTEDDLLSDTSGLAARQKHSASEQEQVRVPLIAGVHPEREVLAAQEFVSVPAEVVAGKPHAYALVVKDDDMSQMFPVGSHAIINPDEPVPENGSPVAFKMQDFQSVDVLWTSGHRILFRLWYVGVTHLMLSPRSYRNQLEDIVMRLEDAASSIELLGTVIWFQAARPLPNIDLQRRGPQLPPRGTI